MWIYIKDKGKKSRAFLHHTRNSTIWNGKTAAVDRKKVILFIDSLHQISCSFCLFLMYVVLIRSFCVMPIPFEHLNINNNLFVNYVCHIETLDQLNNYYQSHHYHYSFIIPIDFVFFFFIIQYQFHWTFGPFFCLEFHRSFYFFLFRIPLTFEKANTYPSKM